MDWLNFAVAPATLSANICSAAGASGATVDRLAQASGTTSATGSSQASVLRPCTRRFPAPESLMAAMALGTAALLSQVEFAVDLVQLLLHHEILQSMQAVDTTVVKAGPHGLIKVAPAHACTRFLGNLCGESARYGRGQASWLMAGLGVFADVLYMYGCTRTQQSQHERTFVSFTVRWEDRKKIGVSFISYRRVL